MKYSIRKKVALYSFLLIILAFGVGLLICAVFSSKYFTNVARNEMSRAYSFIKEKYVEDASQGIFEKLTEKYTAKLNEICEENGFSMLIVTPAGFTSYSYGYSGILYDRLNYLVFGQADDGISILEKGEDYTIQTVKGGDGKIKYVEMWGFLYDGSSFIYRCPYSGIQNNITVSLRFYLIVCILVFSIFAVIVTLTIKTFTDPLRRLAEVTVRINEGEYDSRYTSKRKRNDEIGVLSENVYEMAQKLEKSVSELKTANLNLKNDLRGMEQKEEARKKYMSDVSHELKTPVALISGYAEGLKEGIFDSPEDRDYYCDVIIDEAEKMNMMVKKLSTLNQLEQGKSAVNLERFNVTEVIAGFIKNMSMIIEENNASVEFDDSRSYYVWSDEFLFEEVLVNYFNNALHHMDDKKKIRIWLENSADNIRVTVFNTGSHIPEDELTKIWDKFYKVDKARTREYGGQGLGLSIVKAIAASLDKECGVYNAPGGVAFYIDLESADTYN